ncbi:hypothetical protein GWI33_008056, partial [Rhynchophorus ferrugineus]
KSPSEEDSSALPASKQQTKKPAAEYSDRGEFVLNSLENSNYGEASDPSLLLLRD